MQRKLACGAVCVLAMAVPGVAQEAKATHVAITAAEVKWGEPPPVLAKGALFAVMSGDPGKAGPFVIRLKMPPDTRSRRTGTRRTST